MIILLKEKEFFPKWIYRGVNPRTIFDSVKSQEVVKSLVWLRENM